MGSFCGTNSQTVVNTASNPNVTAQQDRIYGNVNAINEAYRDDPSQLVAPWNDIQTQAVQGIANQSTANLPWNYLGQGMVGQGSSMAATAPYFYGQATNELGGSQALGNTPWNPTPYESPYTQDVINTTMANINRNNAIQQNGALGNAIAQGNAFGGDRAGVAMSELARNQALASNQTMAQLQQADFNQASQQANAQQQYGLNLGQANNARALQQANAYAGLGNNMVQAGLAQGNLGTQAGNLGNQGQQGALNGLGALYNAGTNLQNTQQQQLSSPMTLASWMAATSPGTGATPTSTTYPGSNPAATIAGLGLTGIAGAGLLSNLGVFGALLKDGGRVNKQVGGGVGMPGGGSDSIADRYHDILQKRMAFQNGGGAGQQPMPPADPISNNVVQAKDTAPVRAAALLRDAQRLEQIQTGRPGERELGYNMMQSQGMQEGGGVDPAAGDMGSLGDAKGTGLPGMADAAERERKRKLRQMMGLGQMGVNMANGAGNSPTQAPHAPGAGGGMLSPQAILSMADMGRQFGGPVDSDDPGTTDDGAPPLMGEVLSPQRRGFDPYRYMDKPAPGSYAAAQQSPWMAALAAGLGMMGKAGARDAHGLPISGAAAIGQGAQAGFEHMKTQADQQQKQRETALRARQLEAEWAQHQAQLRLQTGIALGAVNGPNGPQQTLAAQQLAETVRHNTQPQYHAIQNEWGAQTPAVFDPKTGAMRTIPNVGTGDANDPAAAGASNTGAAYAAPTGLDWSLRGEAFLNQLPPQWRATVEKVGSGEIPFPSVNSRDPRAKLTGAMVANAFPGFDATQWAARNKMRTAYGAGTEGRNIGALKLLLEHAEEMSHAAEDLNNMNVPLGNLARSVTNPAFAALNPEVAARFKRYEDSRNAVAEELSKVFHGGPTVTGVEHWRDVIGPTNSAVEQRAHIGTALKLAEGRLNGLTEGWERTMGAPPEKPYLSPDQVARIKRLQEIGRLGVSPDEYDKKHGKGNGAKPSAAVKEGATAINKETGQRIIFKGGQWQPIQ